MSEFKISLAAARVNANLTQAEAAKQLGIANNTLIKWEKGEDFPKISQMRELCNLYQIDADHLKFPENQY